MPSISVDIRYNKKCPQVAHQIESSLFDRSFSFEGDSYTCEDHVNHNLGFNYDCMLVAKNAYKRIRQQLSTLFRNVSEIHSYDISLSDEKKFHFERL